MAVSIGDMAPNFILLDQDGVEFQLSHEIGRQNLLIYFYPKDETPGCITEACTFRDNINQFNDFNCKIIGISSDGKSTHAAFAEHYNLPFTLLSDPRKKVRKMFGVKAAIPGILPGRKTFLIDREGIITNIFEHQFNPKQHVKDALIALENA